MAYKPTKKHLQLCYDAGFNSIERSKLLESLPFSRKTYYKFSEFSEMYKKGEEDALPDLITTLHNSLYKECTGYHINEETKDGTVTKYMRPNMTGIMFALVNRDPGNWQSINKEKLIVQAPNTYNITYSKYQ